MTTSIVIPARSKIEEDLEAEAHRLLAEIERRDLSLRLLGGMAIRLVAGDRLHPAFDRAIQDLDFVVRKRDRREAEGLFSDFGYLGDQQFNALNGARRLLYLDPVHDRQIDVFVETFEMCHVLPLVDRLPVRPQTLAPAELVLTKLQIVHLNAKDRGDLYALLGSQEPDGIDLEWIAEVTGDDWGLEHTIELNLGRLRDGLAEQGLEREFSDRIEGHIEAIAAAISQGPKSRRWKLRARVGERKRWYAEPEEIDRAG